MYLSKLWARNSSPGWQALPGHELPKVWYADGEKVKIILTTIQPNLETELDPRFGRSAYLLVVDPHTMEWRAEVNPGAGAGGGAGVHAAQLVSKLQATAVISGHFGPNAYDALSAAGVEMYQFADCQTAREAISNYLEGKLPAISAATRGEGHSRGQFRV